MRAANLHGGPAHWIAARYVEEQRISHLSTEIARILRSFSGSPVTIPSFSAMMVRAFFYLRKLEGGR